MSEKEGRGVSMLELSEGGFLDDVDCVIRNPHFTMTDFKGKSENGEVPVLEITLLSMEDGTTEQILWLTVGSNDYWAVSQDGSEIIPIGSNPNEQKITTGSNFGYWLSHLINAGLLETIPEFDNDITVLEGLIVHVVRQVRPLKKGSKGPEKEITVVTAIVGREDAEEEKSAKTAIKRPGKKVVGKKLAKKTNKLTDEQILEVEALIVSILEQKEGWSDTIENMTQDIMDAVQALDIDSKIANLYLETPFTKAFALGEERPWTVITNPKTGKSVWTLKEEEGEEE